MGISIVQSHSIDDFYQLAFTFQAAFFPPGPDAPGLSAGTITRLKADWWDDHERWSKRVLATRHCVYFWADDVYFSPRMDEDRQCMLVIIGAASRAIC
jgi:hypothetical protein